VLGICNETLGRLLDRFRRIRATEPDPLEALKEMCESYVLYALTHRDEYRLLFMSKDLLMLEFAEELAIESDEDAIRHGILGPLVLRELSEHVALCIERGILRPGDPALLTEAIWSCGHGIASLLITHPHFKNRPHDQLIASAMDMVLNGLLKR
jgi:AcrR family transcriptional regulator